MIMFVFVAVLSGVVPLLVLIYYLHKRLAAVEVAEKVEEDDLHWLTDQLHWTTVELGKAKARIESLEQSRMPFNPIEEAHKFAECFHRRKR